MTFPLKFKELLETGLDDVELPDYCWLVYSVCGSDPDSCGWGGWMTDGVFKIDGKVHNTRPGDKLLPSVDPNCPVCGKPLFRTDAYVCMKYTDKKRVFNFDYEVVPMEYE